MIDHDVFSLATSFQIISSIFKMLGSRVLLINNIIVIDILLYLCSSVYY